MHNVGRGSPSLLARGPSWVRAQAVAPTTGRTQARLEARLRGYAAQHHVPVDYQSAQQLVCSHRFRKYKPSTILTYAKHLQTILFRMRVEKTPEWVSFMNGLRKLFGRAKKAKAKPLPYPFPREVTKGLSSHQKWLLHLAYSTACRLGDLKAVLTSDLTPLPQPATGVSVRLPITKEDRLAHKSQAVLVSPVPFKALPPGLLMPKPDRAALSRALKRWGGSDHSIRRGALQRALLLPGDLELFKNLARHKSVDTTLEYLEGLPRNQINPSLWSLSQSLLH